MDFLGTWRTRDGRIAAVDSAKDGMCGGTIGDAITGCWNANGEHISGYTDLDLMERISDRWGAKEGE